jgi:transcriptional regulator with XRE-family HTH domain
MSPDELKALRQELSCTARELAAALGVEPDTVIAWERSEQFPTKRHIGLMEDLRRKGPSSIPRKRRKGGAALPPMQALADPSLWRLLRKLLAHPELRAAADTLADAYPDPADPVQPSSSSSSSSSSS